jgi:hypothetical protein
MYYVRKTVFNSLNVWYKQISTVYCLICQMRKSNEANMKLSYLSEKRTDKLVRFNSESVLNYI